MDKGPWRVITWKATDVAVLSDDFTHDTALIINGDFEDREQRLAYAAWLAAALNKEAERASSEAREGVDSNR